jgi:hypothetical protein
MTREEYIKGELARWRGIFKEHVVTVIAQDERHTLFEFRNPKSWCYGMRVLVHAQWVCFMGDIYEATYQWGETVTLDFLAGIDFAYFHGKCRAAATGKAFVDWNGAVAEHGVTSYLVYLEEGQGRHDYVARLRDLQTFDKEQLTDIADDAYDQTGDCETASMISEFGEVPAVCCIGQFVGLQMAIAHLQQQAGGAL